MKGKRVSRSSVILAAALLEELGFKVIEAPMHVVINGVRISDIDIVAERDGVTYAVEVKAGMADVSSVRQAYVNAKLTGYKPMIIARGVDEAAALVAKELSVEVITLPDMLVAGPDEIREIVEEAVYDAITRVIGVISSCNKLSDDEVRLMYTLLDSDTISDFAEKLGVQLDEAARILASLRRKLGIGSASFKTLRALAGIALTVCKERRL